MAKMRQLSQREVKQIKQDREGGPMVHIYNPGLQMVTLRLKGEDFFLGEQVLHIRGKKTASARSNRLDWDQLTNLQKRGLIKVNAPEGVR